VPDAALNAFQAVLPAEATGGGASVQVCVCARCAFLSRPRREAKTQVPLGRDKCSL